ncbi:hypothetical protein AAC387_Pa10g0978 [Persea americana]
MAIPPRFIFITSLVFLCFSTPCFHAAESITAAQPLTTNETMSSPNRIFELGFFPKSTISNSTIFYLAIWQSNSKRHVVWVSNREDPIRSSSPSLRINPSGNLIISSSDNTTEIPITSVTSTSTKTAAKLLDSGNLVLLEEATGRVLWQSSDHPTDTLLPGMKLRNLTSWLTNAIPYPGPFTLGLDPKGPNQFVIWYRGLVYWKSSLWNSSGSIRYVDYSFGSDEDGKYFNFTINQKSDDDHSNDSLQITSSGKINWLGLEMCSQFGGNPGLVECSTWTWPNCSKGKRSEFSKGTRTRFEFNVLDGNSSLGLADCEFACKSSCSCVAYTTYNEDGTGCLYRFDDMYGKSEIEFYDRDVFVRANGENPSPVPRANGGNPSAATDAKRAGRKRWKLWIIIILPVGFIILLYESVKCHLQRTRVQWEGKHARRKLSVMELYNNGYAGELNDIGKEGLELPIFSFHDVIFATDNFSVANKLGEGGFGTVYKGTSLNEQDVAVKRLSGSSGQGLEEFKTEVFLISKLQHKNLVKLIGMCIHGEEKILIYEYMPNKSLDFFLFDPTKRQVLDWAKRVHIIDGIAQGLLYLHKYSRLPIIHRDLKASNILLDGDMNPKISDFGMARMFNRDQSKAITNRVVGTYGYMSPEYAMDGLFSVKSDVYSFGVLLLEIMTSKKNTGFYHLDQSLSLLGYVWRLWNEGRGLQMIDPMLVDSSPAIELMRYIHVALLCVQERATDRPTMSEVVLFLNNRNAAMLSPKQPAFFIARNAPTESLPASGMRPCSVNDMTISTMGGR